jgi:RNA polymerase sigma-70 factor, ECF subfamily
MSAEPASRSEISRQLDLLTRRERGRLIAGLVNRLGSQHLELAEDVAQEAMLIALSIWPYRGMPDNPAAWLAQVARNKAIDRLRRENRERPFDEALDVTLSRDAPHADPERIQDPELRLTFLCCQSELTGIDQLALTLRVVSGFTAQEIAEIFLSTPAAMAQRLSRSKRKLKQLDQPLTEPPTIFEIESRLPAVLSVVYLMFSLGYAPRSGSQLIRRDVALEALRLARELADQKHTARPEASALAALLSFQASRFDAREDAAGKPVLLKDQDRSLWDRALVEQGVAYLRKAMQGDAVSRYHLEAGIASVYATSASWEDIDWPAIRVYYEHLECLVDSPVVVISSSVAQAFAGEPVQSLARLDALVNSPVLVSYAPFHIARAEVLKLLGRDGEASRSFSAAISSGVSAPVIEHLEKRLASSL